MSGLYGHLARPGRRAFDARRRFNSGPGCRDAPKMGVTEPN